MNKITILSGRVLLTLAMVGCAAVLSWHLWSFYMEAPWTRDAHVRADIVRLAPDVSGPVAAVLVTDNTRVQKGGSLFRIETDRFEIALREAEAEVESTAAAAVLARTDFERYQRLASKEAASLKQMQQAKSEMQQADAAHQSALAARDLARLNLERTTVTAPAPGTVTNFSLRAGNYVSAGSPVGVLLERQAIYVAGYFEETKLPRIHLNDRVRIDIMGEPEPVFGHVASIAAGIEDRERSDTAGSLASVAPNFPWVRLAQRIPVRIEIDDIPETVRLTVGRSATVTVEEKGKSNAKPRQSNSGWRGYRFPVPGSELRKRWHDSAAWRNFRCGLFASVGLINQPDHETADDTTGIHLAGDDRDITRPRNPDVRQRRHQTTAGDIDFQHGKGTDSDAKPVFHRLTCDEEMVECLARKAGQMLKPCLFQPVRPVAGAGFAGKQRMPLDVCRLPDRTAFEKGRAHDQRVHILQYRHDIMLRPDIVAYDAAPDGEIDAAAQILLNAGYGGDDDFDLRVIGVVARKPRNEPAHRKAGRGADPQDTSRARTAAGFCRD